MRTRRLLLSAGICYAIASIILAVGLGELAFHPMRVPLDARSSAEAIATRFGGVLEDASATASDGAQLQAWYARPAKSNGNAVILIHSIGDNRQGMMGFAELFLSQGYAVLVPDSRAQGNSGGGFPTYGVEESKDVRYWFDWLETRQHPHCTFGMGESMGAAIVLQAVKTTPFCAVVAESPFASFRQISYIRVGQIFRSSEWPGQYALRPSVELAFVYARLTRGVKLTTASPEQSVVGSKVPILLIVMHTSPAFKEAATIMGQKLTHALYMRETGNILTTSHRFLSSCYQPQREGTETLTSYFHSLLPNVVVGVRTNIKSYGTRFKYIFGYKEEGDFLVYCAQFGQGLILWGIVCGANMETPEVEPLKSAPWKTGACGAGANKPPT